MAYPTYNSFNNPDEYITCYIRNMITDETIDFKTTPDGISETYSASWSSHEVLGRSTPYQSFGGNDAHSVSYSVKLSRDALGIRYPIVIKQCKSLVYPKYRGVYAIPPYCYVRFGGMIGMFAIVNSVSVSWDGVYIADDDTDPNRNLLSSAELNFDFTELIHGGNHIPVAEPNGSGLPFYNNWT